MQIVDLIKKKRDKQEHTPEELKFLIDGTVDGSIKDYHLSAWLMAAFIQGLSIEETTELTKLMAYSGDVLDLSSVPGIKIDKHSTGGVGDKVTLVLAPLVASAGVIVAKISGRGLGHTGGTVDKMDAIPGLRTDLTIDEFLHQLKTIGISLIGQTQNLTPADKIFYALRDVTGTVESLPLITASILSKKIAAGADIILLDIKYGSGAFMKTFEDAKKLSEMLVTVGKKLGKSVTTAISDMDQPLGFTIGHTLEVIEAIETLKGKGPQDLTKLCLRYAAILLHKAKKVKTIEEAEILLKKNISNGKAIEKFREFIEAQGGNPDVINNYDLMPKAEHHIDILSEHTGFVTQLSAIDVAETAKLLGAGRDRKEDKIDLGVGVELKIKRGQKVNKGTLLAVLHANSLKHIEKALLLIQHAYVIGDKAPLNPPLIKEIIS
ncbi:MAG: thymidine phosphorylase [Candidatus Sericytochromatia bacterium]|nr:thymidine phosphorylase [Candidatus Sericytochromatia bacterium]